MTIELKIDSANTKTVVSKLTFVPTCIGSVSSDQILIDTVNLPEVINYTIGSDSATDLDLLTLIRVNHTPTAHCTA